MEHVFIPLIMQSLSCFSVCMSACLPFYLVLSLSDGGYSDSSAPKRLSPRQRQLWVQISPPTHKVSLSICDYCADIDLVFIFRSFCLSIFLPPFFLSA